MNILVRSVRSKTRKNATSAHLKPAFAAVERAGKSPIAHSLSDPMRHLWAENQPNPTVNPVALLVSRKDRIFGTRSDSPAWRAGPSAQPAFGGARKLVS